MADKLHRHLLNLFQQALKMHIYSAEYFFILSNQVISEFWRYTAVLYVDLGVGFYLFPKRKDPPLLHIQILEVETITRNASRGQLYDLVNCAFSFSSFWFFFFSLIKRFNLTTHANRQPHNVSFRWLILVSTFWINVVFRAWLIWPLDNPLYLLIN